MDIVRADRKAIELRRLLVVVFLRVVTANRLPAVLGADGCRVAPVELELHARAQAILGAVLLVVVAALLVPHPPIEGEGVARPFSPGPHGPGPPGDPDPPPPVP